MCLPKEFLPVYMGRSMAVFYGTGWQLLSSLGDAQSCALPTGLISEVRKYALPQRSLQPRRQSRWWGTRLCRVVLQ